MRSEGRGAQLIKCPNTPFIKQVTLALSVMGDGIHVKHSDKGYYSVDSFYETFLAIASDRVKKVIKGYGHYVLL